MPDNTYLVCLPSGRRVQWGAPFDSGGLTPDCRYFGAALARVESVLAGRGLRFVLTWSTTDLPFSGSDVVVLCIGDEWARWPAYADRVAAVFKTHGVRPELPLGSIDLRRPLTRALLVQRARVGALGLPGQLARLRWRLGAERPPVTTIPVGTYQSVAVPPVPWEQRSVDLFFAGSLRQGEHPAGGLRGLVGSPKTHARQALLRTLEELRRGRPDLRIETEVTSSFAAAASVDPYAYSRALADSRIVLAPRGTNPETFRFFEGHRFGCIVVTEPLPEHDFYRSYRRDEQLTVAGWEELPELVDRLLPVGAPRHAARDLHDRAVERWRHELAPERVGEAMVQVLRALPG